MASDSSGIGVRLTAITSYHTMKNGWQQRLTAVPVLCRTNWDCLAVSPTVGSAATIAVRASTAMTTVVATSA
jgi:hypothetical protein